MFGRSLLIVVMPLMLSCRAIAAWIFYDRHWETMSWRLSAGVAGDIALVIDALDHTGPDAARSRAVRPRRSA